MSKASNDDTIITLKAGDAAIIYLQDGGMEAYLPDADEDDLVTPTGQRCARAMFVEGNGAAPETARKFLNDLFFSEMDAEAKPDE